MNEPLTLGEYIRRLRRRSKKSLQELSDATGLSVSHISRLENDNALPSADTVVKLAAELSGDLDRMLELADCLPREILERLIQQAGRSAGAHRRSAGVDADPTFGQALVEDIDPGLRDGIARQFGLSARDVEGLFTVLRRMAQMQPAEREAVIAFLATSARGREP